MVSKKIIFQCEHITKDFGGLRALSRLTFDVREKEIVGIIGPNGAGKTTLFNVISGIYSPNEGSMNLYGESLIKKRPHNVCKMGIGRTYQTVRPFLGFTALDNVAAGLLFGRDERKNRKKSVEEKAAALLKFVGLEGKERIVASDLNLVERKKIELARAIGGNPKLLLLDEILSGLNPGELESAMLLIKKIRDELGITIMWIEHLMRALMGICERVIVLHNGTKIAEGTPQEVSVNKEVGDVYLGTRG